MANAEFLGKGFGFPVSVDPKTGRMNMSSNEESIKESIYLILMTRKGERPMRSEFGCDIFDYIFDPLDYSSMNRMQEAVMEALVMWEPRITDIEVEVTPSDTEGKVFINISYVVRATNNPYNLVFPFYMNEGLGE